MRTLIALSFMTFTVPAFSQEQETKLLDRLLRPDLSLQNDAQNKHFVLREKQILDKQIVATRFPAQKNATTKLFPGAREFNAKTLATPRFRDGDGTASMSGIAHPTKTASFASNATIATANATENGRAMATSDFAGNRVFLGQGKSQKALTRKNQPLTVDQVRELLNKNK